MSIVERKLVKISVVCVLGTHREQNEQKSLFHQIQILVKIESQQYRYGNVKLGDSFYEEKKLKRQIGITNLR